MNLYCCCSVTKLCLILCDLMDCSTPGCPVLHYLPEFAQTHVHWIGMASNHLTLCCPLLLLHSIFPRIRVFSNESALHIRWPKDWNFSFNIILSMNTQDWSSLGWTGRISLQSKELSRVFSNTTVQKHQFFGAQPDMGICGLGCTEITLFYCWPWSVFWNIEMRQPGSPF